jgi:hypothetical protein
MLLQRSTHAAPSVSQWAVAAHSNSGKASQVAAQAPSWTWQCVAVAHSVTFKPSHFSTQPPFCGLQCDAAAHSVSSKFPQVSMQVAS